MPTTFQCPNCNGPLDYDGRSVTVRCQYCNSSVVVPPELRGAGSGAVFRPGAGFYAASDIQYDMAEALEQVMELAQRGNKIEAIKVFRATFGVGLKEAKDIVEALERGQVVNLDNLSVQPGMAAGVDDAVELAGAMAEIRDLARQGQKIEAIKRYRAMTNVGLAEAKEAVESLEAGRPVAMTQVSTNFGSSTVRMSGSSAQISTSAFGDEVQKKSGSRLGCIIGFVLVLVVALAITPIVLGVVGTGGALFAVNRAVPTLANLAATAVATYTPAPTPTPGFLTPVMEFGAQGIGPGQFEDARYLAMDIDGNIYTAEYTGGRIQKFNQQGKYLTQWTVDKELPIRGFAASRDGIIYLTQRSKIWRFDGKTGQPLGELPVAGDYRFDHIKLTPEGGLIAISESQDIVKLDANGQVLLTIPQAVSSVTGDNELETHLAIDGLGGIYLSASFNNAVLLYSPEGRFNNRFGEKGNNPGQFNHPGAIAVDGSGRIYVASGVYINIFTPNGLPVAAFRSDGVAQDLIFTDAGDLLTITNQGKVIQFTVQPPQ